MQFYDKSLNIDLENNYVKCVSFQYSQPEFSWYLLHHPLSIPNKREDVRMLANAASMNKGVSLKSCLETGPDASKQHVLAF